MNIQKNNPYRPAKRKGEVNRLRNPFRDTQTKRVYAALIDKDDSLIAFYENSSTLTSMRVQLRTMSVKLHEGERRFKLVDNGDGETITIYRIC
jgi:hypothetical protein